MSRKGAIAKIAQNPLKLRGLAITKLIGATLAHGWGRDFRDPEGGGGGWRMKSPIHHSTLQLGRQQPPSTPFTHTYLTGIRGKGGGVVGIHLLMSRGGGGGGRGKNQRYSAIAKESYLFFP